MKNKRLAGCLAQIILILLALLIVLVSCGFAAGAVFFFIHKSIGV